MTPPATASAPAPAPTLAPPRTLTSREAIAETGLAPLGRVDLAAPPGGRASALQPAPALHVARLEDGREVAVVLALGAGAPEEARTAALLRHEGLPRLLEVRRGKGFRALVLEAVRGPSLARALSQEGPLAPRGALRMGIRLARALAHAHDQGLVHGALDAAAIALAGEPPPESAPRGETWAQRALLLGRFTDTAAPLIVARPSEAGALAASREGDLAALGRVIHAALTGRVVLGAAGLASAALPPELSLAQRVLERCLRLRPEIGFYPDGRALAAALEAVVRRLGEAKADLTGRFTRDELAGVLQMLELQRKSGHVELESAHPGRASGALTLRHGRIEGARAGAAQGRDALMALLSLEEGRFRVTFGAPGAEPAGEDAVGADRAPLAISAALLEAARRRDEGSHL